MSSPKRIAVIGSGVSGLSATWLLNEYSPHEVHLFESDARFGGHANTVHFPPSSEDKQGTDVDTGFIVFNPSTYPNFLRFATMKELDIKETEMTFALSRRPAGDAEKIELEWAGDDLGTVFTQRKRVLDKGMWRLVWDVLRFNVCARKLLYTAGDENTSLGEYLFREGYSDRFRDDYLIPMTAAIWSMPIAQCASEFPIKTLVQFMKNHHLLQITGKPNWLTFPKGSHTYLRSILCELPDDRKHLNTLVVRVRTYPTAEAFDNGKESSAVRKPFSHRVDLTYVTDGIEKTEWFDHVIFACHSDTALSILRGDNQEDSSGPMLNDMKDSEDAGIMKREEEILSKFKWSKNEAVLHFDERLMPASKRAWSCWNYLAFSNKDGVNGEGVSLTYGMNTLQHISLSQCGPVLVTLNPPPQLPIDPAKVAGKWDYEHPVMDLETTKAQPLLPSIQAKRGLSFCGAWTKYGFHEDGWVSGMIAAGLLLPDSANEKKAIEHIRYEEDPVAYLNATKSRSLPFMIVPSHSDAPSPSSQPSSDIVKKKVDIPVIEFLVQLFVPAALLPYPKVYPTEWYEAQKGSMPGHFFVLMVVFELLEQSRVRPLVGSMLGAIVGLVAWILGLNV